jgi:hypothetical protein
LAAVTPLEAPLEPALLLALDALLELLEDPQPAAIRATAPTTAARAVSRRTAAPVLLCRDIVLLLLM